MKRVTKTCLYLFAPPTTLGFMVEAGFGKLGLSLAFGMVSSIAVERRHVVDIGTCCWLWLGSISIRDPL